MTGSLQIVDLVEQPGAILVQWYDEVMTISILIFVVDCSLIINCLHNEQIIIAAFLSVGNFIVNSLCKLAITGLIMRLSSVVLDKGSIFVCGGFTVLFKGYF